MAHKYLLPISRLNEFAEVLIKDGWTRRPQKGIYEALRFTHPMRNAIVIFFRGSRNARAKSPRVRGQWATIRSGCPSLPILKKWLKVNPNQNGDVPNDRDTDPDWTGSCEVCDQSPIVPATGMCGPCTFGEAATAGGNW